MFVHQSSHKMAEPGKKYVDGADYYGDTTYLWRNMKVLGIITCCKYTSCAHRTSLGFAAGSLEEDFERDLFFSPLLSLVRL